jgi:Outer membrane protein beta-barrel domain
VKKILLIAVLALSCYTMQAQMGPGPQIEFGLKAGFSDATLTDMGQEVYGYSSIPSLHAGALLNIKFSDRASGFALQPEAVFSGQGGLSSYNSGGYYYNFTTNLVYLNIPVLLQYQFRRGWRIETGPQFGLLLSASDYNYYDQGGTVDRKSIYHKSDFSWAFGGGFITRSGFGIDARANIGLSDINSDTNPGEDENMNNDVFQLGAFYQFGHPRYSRY